jgi:hypothetical protein
MKTKIKKTLKVLTINRDKWGQGALLTHDNKMCCLGFACKAIGYDLEKEAEEFDEDNVDDGVFGRPADIFGFSGPKWLSDPPWINLAIQVNDELSGQDREDEIRGLFAEKGCKIRFTGGKKARKQGKTKTGG